jgi:hypothetical protein
MTRKQWSGAKDPGPQYAAAGALAWYLMEGEGRRYRADFIDFLRDSYHGSAAMPLAAYLGLSDAELASGYAAWQDATATDPRLQGKQRRRSKHKH